MRSNDLAAVKDGLEPRFWLIKFDDLREFLRSRENDASWHWLRRVAEMWAEARGAAFVMPISEFAGAVDENRQASEQRKEDLQHRADQLRKDYPKASKGEIAAMIAKTSIPKFKGDGVLSSEAIEREIRLPRLKRSHSAL